MRGVDMYCPGRCYTAHLAVQTGSARQASKSLSLSRAISQTDQLSDTSTLEPPPLTTTTIIILTFGEHAVK